MLLTKNEMETSEMRKSRRVRISSKRQFSIPKEYYDFLGMENEAIIELHGNRLVVRPVNEDEERGAIFAEHIYRDVIADGFEGEDIITEVERRKKLIRPAVEDLINDAHKYAEPFSADTMFDDLDDEDEEVNDEFQD